MGRRRRSSSVCPKGLFFVSFQPKPGWKRTVTTEKLDPPVELFGEMQTERVATVTWEGGKIAPGEFDEFGMSVKVPDAPGQTLAFPANQTYSNGDVVRWIGAPDSETPASRITLGPKEAEETTATTAAPASATSASTASDGDDGLNTEKLALGFGIAGLIAGLAALALTLFRRPRSASAAVPRRGAPGCARGRSGSDPAVGPARGRPCSFDPGFLPQQARGTP